MPPVGKVIVKDLGMKKIVRDLERADGWQVTVGVHGQDAGERGDFDEIDNVALAAIHEFGAPGAGIPERSFLRAAFDKNVRKYVQVLLIGARKIIAGTGTPKQAVGLAGEVAVADVANLINAGIPPPNAPATIEAKGSSKPLIDTGQLKQSVKPVVQKK
jgi:hypothetical protein